ncbi:MAG TPA: lecithin retinol acyltransferase family protein, partial [Candidatus Hydrogenedentes bacterium]|nr:lecithin retinol acyltransferase family protein [Candidatus Hydrogenedentota bacterium]
MARGDHIKVRRFLYSHHGIDCGDGTVIHYTGSPLHRMSRFSGNWTIADFSKRLQ